MQIDSLATALLALAVAAAGPLSAEASAQTPSAEPPSASPVIGGAPDADTAGAFQSGLPPAAPAVHGPVIPAPAGLGSAASPARRPTR